MNKLLNIYLDTSAVLKLLIDEAGSQNMKTYFYKFREFHMLSLCFIETLSMLKVKHFYRKNIPRKKYFSAVILLLIHCDNNIKIHYVEMPHIDNVFINIANLVNEYNIDFIDAFQIDFLKRVPLSQHARLITADSTLERAAKAEKIKVWNCINDKIPWE